MTSRTRRLDLPHDDRGVDFTSKRAVTSPGGRDRRGRGTERRFPLAGCQPSGADSQDEKIGDFRFANCNCVTVKRYIFQDRVFTEWVLIGELKER